jgi:hypothetical protein
MKCLPTLILAVSATFTLFTAAHAAPATASITIASPSAEAPIEPGQLRTQLLRSDSDDIAGTMSSASGAMSFSTTSLQTGKAAIKGAAPDRVRARLEINGAVIDHEIDYAAGMFTVRTASPLIIDAADRDVLRTFHTELGRSLSAQAGGMQNMPKAHDMLWRLAEMYSEVPLGKRLPAEWVIRRDNNASRAEPAPKAVAEPGAWQPAAGAPSVVALACSEQSGGSFTNLHNIVDVCRSSQVFYRASAHDYCPTHGYTSKTVAYGCGASSCPGRCGAGCGVADGLGAWYQDCLDHDVCNRDHNSQLGACGDEWTEAADDYAFGAISCYTTCH